MFKNFLKKSDQKKSVTELKYHEMYNLSQVTTKDSKRKWVNDKRRENNKTMNSRSIRIL